MENIAQVNAILEAQANHPAQAPAVVNRTRLQNMRDNVGEFIIQNYGVLNDVFFVLKLLCIIFLGIGILRLWLSIFHVKHPVSFSCKPNLVVARDGTGNFKTIAEAIDATPHASEDKFCIFVKAGMYEETLSIARNKTNIAIMGESSEHTVIHSSKDIVLRATGSGFMAANITIKNSGSPKNGTTALYSASNEASFFRCRFIGKKGTLYLEKNLFFRDCEISGTDRIISGTAAAIFQNSTIYVGNTRGHDSVITSHERNDVWTKSGFVFQRCRRTTTSSIQPVNSIYLGSPGGRYSTVVIMESFLTGIIKPAGWISNDHLDTNKVYFGEYNNSGPGGVTNDRVKWSGVKVMNKSEAVLFTLSYFFNEIAWISSTGTPHWEDL